jgi:putative membrane protein
MSQISLTLAAIACALALAGAETSAQNASAPAQSSAPAGKTTSPMADKKFVDMAAMGGMTEVKLGELAATQGDSQSVKDFGKHMVGDHTKANDELAKIANDKGVPAPAALDGPHQKVVDKFTTLKGAAFDRAYWNQMLDDHQKTIALFQGESTSGKDADFRAFASKTLPTLKMHLQMVHEAMKGKTAK